MLACWSERGVSDSGNSDFQKRPLGKTAILRIVTGTLQIIHSRTDMDDAAEHCLILRGKLGQGIQSEIDFRDTAAATNVFHLQQKVRIEGRWLDEAKKCLLHVHAGDDALGSDFFAAF